MVDNNTKSNSIAHETVHNMPRNNLQCEEVLLFLEQLAVRPDEDILYFMKRTTASIGTLRRYTVVFFQKVDRPTINFAMQGLGNIVIYYYI